MRLGVTSMLRSGHYALMRRRGKKRDFSSAMAYRCDRRIAIVGLAPRAPEATTSDLLAVVDGDADDLELGTALLSVLEERGKRSPSDQHAEICVSV
jgi:hypothetical protein